MSFLYAPRTGLVMRNVETAPVQTAPTIFAGMRRQVFRIRASFLSDTKAESLLGGGSVARFPWFGKEAVLKPRDALISSPGYAFVSADYSQVTVSLGMWVPFFNEALSSLFLRCVCSTAPCHWQLLFRDEGERPRHSCVFLCILVYFPCRWYVYLSSCQQFVPFFYPPNKREPRLGANGSSIQGGMLLFCLHLIISGVERQEGCSFLCVCVCEYIVSKNAG